MGRRRRGELDGESPSLPASRAFVVQLSGDTQPRRGRVRGRAEHIESGRSQQFGTLEELMAFVGEVLEAIDREE